MAAGGGDQYSELRATIREQVVLLRHADPLERQAAAFRVWMFALNHEAKAVIVAAGAIAVLQGLITSSDEGVKASAIGALRVMTTPVLAFAVTGTVALSSSREASL